MMKLELSRHHLNKDKANYVVYGQDDAMVISATIVKFPIERILIDNGSSVNLIYQKCFEKMNLSYNILKKVPSPLFSFSRELVPIIRSIQLSIMLGEEPRHIARMANFMVIKFMLLAYNAILGRPLLNDIRAVLSSSYLLMKFPSS
ncbi:Acid proteases protein [Dioscorea alata]|uniref:Acid proteases protein n=1 Tax=Dioscorea alata TaxID=55571 RepID=A0ACB7VIV9_DIOAL|nr:Acid proteases protein [Dioscorea alata]